MNTTLTSSKAYRDAVFVDETDGAIVYFGVKERSPRTVIPLYPAIASSILAFTLGSGRKESPAFSARPSGRNNALVFASAQIGRSPIRVVVSMPFPHDVTFIYAAIASG